MRNNNCGASNWLIGAIPLSSPQATLALLLADKFDTVKLSCVYKVSSATTAAAEATYKVAKGDATFTAGCGVRTSQWAALQIG